MSQHLNDRRELLKLKQGLVSPDESPLEIDSPPVKEKLTGKAWLSNFIYHHNLHLKMAAFFLSIAAVFAFFILTAEKPDIKVLLIASTPETSMFFATNVGELKGELETFTPDFNGNGKVYVECRFIDLVTHVGDIERNPEAIHGSRVKLFGEVLTGEALIFIGNKKALEDIPGDVMPFEDFYYAVYSVDETKLQLSVPIPDDLYVAIRNSDNEDEFLKALTVFESITQNITTTD